MSTKHSTEVAVSYKLLDFMVDEGYRIGTNGSVQSRWKSQPIRGKGRGRGWEHILSQEWSELKPGRCKSMGHLTVCLQTNGIAKSYYVHRLVLLAFVGPCPPGMQCRHLNGRPWDNRLENLCWGTSKEDAQDKKRLGTLVFGEKSWNATLTEEKVREIRRLYATGEYILDQLAEMFGVSQHTIWKVVNRRSWIHVE